MTKLAVQLYTMRNNASLEENLKAVSEAGYDGVETVGTHDQTIDEMQALLDQYGLKICSSHVSISELESNLEHHIKFNKALGNPILVLPYLVEEDRPDSAEGWQALGKRIGKIATNCQASDVTLLYHNHDFEMQSIEGKTILDHLMDAAGTDLGLELDMAWVARGNLDPFDFLNHYQGRTLRVHVKDIAAEGENLDEDGWADVGHGVTNWPPLLEAAAKAGADWFIVEHDTPKDAVKTIQRSKAFLDTQL